MCDFCGDLLCVILWGFYLCDVCGDPLGVIFCWDSICVMFVGILYVLYVLYVPPSSSALVTAAPTPSASYLKNIIATSYGSLQEETYFSDVTLTYEY